MSLLLLLSSTAGVTAVAPTATIVISGQTPTASNSIAPVVATAPTAVVSITAQVPAASPGIAPVVRSVDAAVVAIAGTNPSVIMTPPPQTVTAPSATIVVGAQTPIALARLPYAEPSAGVTIIGAGSTAPIDSIVAQFEGSVIKVERWLDIYEADNVTLWRSKVGMTAGSVSVDMSRDERRNIDVTLFDADGDIPYGPGGLWYDKILKPYRGIRLANGDVFVVPLGEFMIDTCNRPHFPDTIQCAGRDFTKKLKLSKFAQTTTFSAGMSTVEVIRAICVNAGITKLNFIASVGVLPEDVSFERGSERWAAAKGLAESINCELFFDANGYLTLRNFVDPLTAPVSFTFNDTNLVDFTRSSNDSLLYNHVVVYGDGPDNPLIYGEAENSNYASPTSVARLGRRTYTRASQFVVDNYQANQIAQSLLRVMALEQFDMSLTTVVIPWLEAGDAIQVIAPDAADVDPARYLLSGFSIPLELTEMSGSAKRITIIQVPNATPDLPTYPEGPPPSTGNIGYPFAATITVSAVTPTVTTNAATAINETFSTGTTASDANFTQVRGPLSIAGGVLNPGATATEIDWYHNTNLLTTDHWVEADITIGATDPGSHYTALVARSNGGTQTGGGGGGGSGTGVFEVSGRNIIDPNGRKLIPVGMNVTAAPTVFPDAWWQNNTYYANGHVAEAVAWGLNFVRVFVPYDPDGGPTMEAACAGTTNLINEYTAQGIVCMIIVGPPQSRNGYNPRLATLPQYIVTIQDYIVANHKTNPYVWLNMMGEAWEFVGATSNANWVGWEEVNTYLYNRARQQGWTNPQVFTLGGYGQGIVGAAQGTLYDNWKSGKSNVIFDHHCYGVNGNYDEISQSVAAFIGRGNALIIGEFGEHWNRANGGTSALPTDPLGVQWVKDNAWTAAFGVGGIAWNGAMNHYNVYSMRQNPNKHADTASEVVNVPLSDYGRAFWHTDQPRSYVGQVLYDQGQLGPTVNGGGAASGTGTSASGNGLTYYEVELAGDRSALTISKCLNGVYSEIGRWQGTGWNLNETHKVRLEVVGTTLTAVVDGIKRIEVTDTSVTSGTRVGVHAYAASSTSAHSIDNFKAGTSGFGISNPPPPPPPVTGGVSILTETFEGRSQGVSDGTLLNGTNSFARINQAIPVAGYIHQGTPNTYYSGGTGLNVNGQPRFSSTAKNGAFSGRFGLVSGGAGVFGGSFYHYYMDAASEQIYVDWWYRFDSTTAAAAAAGSTPGLWLAREDWSNFNLQTPRLSLDTSLNLSQGGVFGTYSMTANTWYRMTSHINCTANTITTTIRDAGGILRDTIVSTANGVPRVGFIEFGALWCNMQNFGSVGYVYWDDVQVSTNAVAPPPPPTATAPGAPTALTATPGNGQVTLSWQAPASNGGSALTDYEVWRGVVVATSGATFSTLFSTAGGAAANGLAETPPNGLHGYNVPLSVSGGRARPSAPPGEGYGDCIAFPAQNDIGVNHYARAKVVIGSGGVGSGGNGAYTGVMVRVTPTSGSGYPTTAYSWYKFETVGDPNQVRFLEVINGTLGAEQYFNHPIQAGQTYEFELSINGTTLTGKINGVTVFSRTETRLTNGKPGISIYNAVSDQTTLDDFSAGDLSGGQGTQISWTLINDGVGIGTSFTDTGRTNGTQYSYRVRAKNAVGTSGDSNTVTATPTTSVAPPPPPPTSAGDWYIRNGKIGRNGKQFIPIGLNGVAGPRNAPVGDWWNDAGMGNMRGKSAFFVQSGFNFLRINDMYDQTGFYTMQDHMNGIFDVIDEYTARGVVCMPSYHKLGQGNNPTPAQLDANADFQWYWQTLIDRYKTNKLVWLNPLNEPLGLQWDQFETSGNYQYNLMRNKGWPGPIVIDLPQWGGAISVASSRGAAFVAGKTLCIIGYHNYGHVTDDVAILNAQAQGVAIINGEYGEEWPTGKFRASSDWTINNAIRLGTGAVAWWGAGNRNDPYCFYNQMGSAFYDTHLGTPNYYGQRVFNLAANQPPPADL